jgi:hypothetical protein
MMKLELLRRILARAHPSAPEIRVFVHMPLTWTCHVCGEERPDARISVFTTDVSALFGLPAGTVKENVRYCNDRPECVAQGRTKRMVELRRAQREAHR